MTEQHEETLRERDARMLDWLDKIKPGDIVTVALNRTDILTGKVYEAPDASRRIALYVNTTLLRYGNGYPGHYTPIMPAPKEMLR